MTKAQFVVGIDLGTTHCALASAFLEDPQVRLLKVTQLVAPAEVSERALLPSFLYLPSPGEMSPGELALPWDSDENLVGEYARKRGSKSPGRLVSSAKSWICHGSVNRRAAILPWSAPDNEPHVSPYEAQVAFLSHLERCWNQKNPDAPLSAQEVVVTVPASFDEGARTLTSEAAAEAGLGQVRLLEEPQAAFYDYLGENTAEDKQGALREQLKDAKLILVVDVGGGTTDLTLLKVRQGDSSEKGALPEIERIAVGGHLMLGGDNMDAALAMFALNKAKISRPEDATLWSGLVQSARDAKERLLAADAPDEAVISYQARGSRLIGKTKSIVIKKSEALKVLLDGCFPKTGPSEVAERSARAGLTTLGLPYAGDTAVPRHVCSFLRRHADAATEAGANVKDGLPRPDLLLLNGGVFNAPAAVERLQEVLKGWYEQGAPTLLAHTSLETSVAQGAVRSGLARHGLGAVIGGGTAKAYYIGIEHGGKTSALCVAPKKADEGASIVVPDRIFSLVLNRLTTFPLYSYSGDRVDAPGALIFVDEGNEELEHLAPLETLFRAKTSDNTRKAEQSVTIESTLDESGGLQLHLVSVELPPKRWKLEFVLRASKKELSPSPSPAEATTPSAQKREKPDPKVGKASALIEHAFRSKTDAKVKGLRRVLEELLGPRGLWSGATCRTLYGMFMKQEPYRKASANHELTWLRLVGWTLRPGFGVAGDDERLDALWELRSSGPAVPSKGNWTEWWVLWRRVAAGLDDKRQLTLFESLRPWLWPKGKPPPGPTFHGPIEMMRTIAALERIPAECKANSGALFVERAKKLGSYWPLGRVGARVPFHGDSSTVVTSELAEKWLKVLLDLDWEKTEGATFAAASIARFTGDERRDINGALREEVVERLTEAKAAENWIDMVLHSAELAQGDMKRILGDSLPPGLRLSD